MQTITNWIKEHPVLVYFGLTFLISWGGVLILGAPYGMPTTQALFGSVWPTVFIPYFIGPSLSGLLLTGLVDRREGFRRLWSRWLRWRVGIRWYSLALLTVPLLVLLILFLLSLWSPTYLPAIVTSDNRPSLVIMGIVVGLFFGGILEELGWTGFAIPKLRARRAVLATGLIVGFLWGLWHVLPTYWGSGNPSGALSLTLLLPPCVFYVGVLPAYRVLMVWVYDHTESLLVNMLMHTSITASTLFILAPGVTGWALAMYYLILTAIMWGIVAVALAPKRAPSSAQGRVTVRPS